MKEYKEKWEHREKVYKVLKEKYAEIEQEKDTFEEDIKVKKSLNL